MNRQTFWPHLVAVVGVVLLVAVVGSEVARCLRQTRRDTCSHRSCFWAIRRPGGDIFLDVFESNFINNRGDVLFGSSVTTGEEGWPLLAAQGRNHSDCAHWRTRPRRWRL